MPFGITCLQIWGGGGVQNWRCSVTGLGPYDTGFGAIIVPKEGGLLIRGLH